MNTCPSSAAGDFDLPQIPLSCSACPACARNLCQAVARAIGSFPDDPSTEIPQSVHLINARRVIHWGQDFHDVVPLICEGWAASVYILSDGSRQILSILLPGDLASTALLFGAQAGCSVEAHIADATGLSLVHVSKVLSEFRRSGIVKIGDRSLTILEPEALQRIALM
jgi:hypothetical protein